MSQHLRATKKILRDRFFEAHRLTQSWRNRTAPIDRVPPKILVALIRDFWHMPGGGKGVIALTYICRSWREAFMSCPSLWTDLDWAGPGKARVYIEHSQASTINLSLHYGDCLSHFGPFQVISVVPG